MKYDFETVVNRANTGSAKWKQMQGWNPNVPEDIVPFSVADMEIKNPPEISEGLKKYLDATILGYTLPTKSYLKAVCDWMKKRHHWEIKPEWIVGTPGVVNAFYSAIKAFSAPGDGIIVMTPVYYPFFKAAGNENRKVVKNPLINNGTTYVIDYEDLEKKAQHPNNKILLFCSPHNPVGRVWTKEELSKVGEICLQNNVLIVSDEIHFDLIMPGYQHTVFATISEVSANNMIICTAPSKTFNIAGMQVSNIIIPNKKIRDKYTAYMMSTGIFSPNILGYRACELAYTECEEWLNQLIALIHKNHIELKKYIEGNMPMIKVYPLEGTYLQWMDFNALGLDDNALEKLMHEEALLFFDEGYIFGEEGSGYERMNIACPTAVMLEGLERLCNTIKKVLRK